MFRVNDIVQCHCDGLNKDISAQIFSFDAQKQFAYVHFLYQDKRLDQWISVSELKLLSQTENDQADLAISDIPPELRSFETTHYQVTKIRNIETITIGPHHIQTWYFSPYPPPFYSMPHLFICDHCLQYFASQEDLDDHLKSGELTPPGREIYREGNLSIFELLGWKQKIPCQNLGLLSKLFLDHKTLFYDSSGFVYYALCECDENGAHFAAYFSREIESSEGNILACIVALPPYQKKGYGRLLISVAHEMAKRVGRVGGPEKPLSDLGKIAFHNYWRDTIVELLRDKGPEIQLVDDIVHYTSISEPDVISILQELKSVTLVNTDFYDLTIDEDVLQNAITKFESTPKRKVIPNLLIWYEESFE